MIKILKEFRELQDKVKNLTKEVKCLNGKLWDMKHPYGTVFLTHDFHPCRIRDYIKYSPHNDEDIILLKKVSPIFLKSYKIKKDNETTYISITIYDISKETEMTFIIQGDSCVRVNTPLEIKDFDIEVTC